ncbi:MAG TPA: hypothetical protein VIA02_01355, partial [Candidatus Limnocylindria bacterium]
MLAAVLAAPLLPVGLSRAGEGVGIDPEDSTFAPFAEYLASLNYSPESIQAVADATRTYPEPAFFHPTGQPPGITASNVHIAWGVAFEMVMTETEAMAHFGPGGRLFCDQPTVYCYPGRPNLGPESEYYVYVIRTATPLATPNPGARLEVGQAIFNEDPPGGGEARPWVANPAFPQDFFAGANQAFVLRSDLGADWVGFGLAYVEPFQSFTGTPSDVVFDWIDGSTLISYIPESEASGIQSTRAFTFFARNGSTSPADSVAMTSPPIGEPMFDANEVVQIRTGATPQPAPTTSEAPASAP